MERIRTACGEWGTCFWEIDNHGSLTIGEGTGYSLASAGDAPWSRYRDSIRSVRIKGKAAVPEHGRLSYMFCNCENLRTVDLSGLDTAGAEAMNCMFHSCRVLEEINFGENFSTKNVINMSKMFFKCQSLRKLELTCFDTSNVIDMGSMFEGCGHIEKLDLSSFKTPRLISMSRMFGDCGCMKDIDISGFDTSGVTGMSGLFSGCSSIEYIDLSRLNTSSAVNMISMFMNCTSLVYADLSGFVTSRVTDMSWMFFGCRKLTALDLSGFDTSNVVDMSCMFCSCKSMRELDIRGFDVSNVTNMENMFMYCSSLTCLDLSGFDTKNAGNMNDMFTGCEKLASIEVSRKFDFTGSGGASCRLPFTGSPYGRETFSWIKYSTGEELSEDYVPEASDETYYIRGREFSIKYEANGGLGSMADCKSVCFSDETPKVCANAFTPLPNYVFKEWNTKKNGEGIAYRPGEFLRPVCANVVLYAVWAAVPTISRLETPKKIRYGQKLNIRFPYIQENNGEITDSGMEISGSGVDGWRRFDMNSIPEVSYDGYYIRCFAVNFVGTAYTESVQIAVEKAEYDMSKVHWTESVHVYDGTMKKLSLEGLPDGVSVEYEGNRGISAGIYTASAKLNYDENNYIRPDDIEDHRWEIKKAVYDMTGVKWSYEFPFVYDGEEKEVQLEGIPEGISAIYSGNKAVDAGAYTATVEFAYDEKNYEPPIHPGRCVWGIKKADIDMSGVSWDYGEAFTYDGTEKNTVLKNLPEGVLASYTGSRQTNAGVYTAKAVFGVEDTRNYKAPDSMEIIWGIKKADIDMSGAYWYRSEDFVYDGKMKAVILNCLPDGVNASYIGNTGTNAGIYMAEAILSLDDPNNYNIPEVESFEWKINKADYDMSRTAWRYDEAPVYDGNEKTVIVEGLPEGVLPVYDGHSATNAGRYTAKVYLRYDEENYNPPAVKELEWEIKKADCDISRARWSYTSPFVYDGNEKEVFIENLPSGISVSYSGNKGTNAGDYRAEAMLTADDSINFKDPAIEGIQWTIGKSPYDMSGVFWEYNDDFIYDGRVKTIRLKNMPAGASAEYIGNTAEYAGDYRAEAKITIEDTDNYLTPESEYFDWRIQKAEYDMSGVHWEYSDDFIYDGHVKEVGLAGLPDGVVAVYSENRAVYAAEYIASASFEYDERNYEIPVVENCRWSIKKAVFDLQQTRWAQPEEFSYDGTEKSVFLTELPDGVTVEYIGNTGINAGEYIASAKFVLDDTVNYEAPSIEDFSWSIEKADVDMSMVKWSETTGLVYDGQPKTVYLKNLPDGVVAAYEGNCMTDAGQYEAEAIFKVEDTLNFNIPDEMTCKWQIEKADPDVSCVAWSYEEPFTYDGEKKGVILIGLPDGITAEYEGNEAVNVGLYEARAVLSVEDRNNYNDPDEKKCIWAIEKADYDMSGVVWNCKDIYYNGTEQNILITGLPEGVKAVYEGNRGIYSGSYQAKASFEISDDVNYNVPEPLGITWEIKKADYDMSGVSWQYDEQPCIYDGNAKTVRLVGLPKGVIAAYDGNNGFFAGDYTARAVFAVDDARNYNIPEEMEFRWEIKKASYDMSSVVWDYTNPFVYDGSEKIVSLLNLPDGITVSYSGSRGTDAGDYCAKAVFTVDTVNYELPGERSCRWSVEKADVDVSMVRWDYDNPFEYDGNTKTVRLTGVPEGIAVEYSGNTAIAAGSYKAEAVLTAEDYGNYNNPPMQACSWEIEKADFDMSNVSWNYEEAFVYDGWIKEINLTGLPEGLEAKCRGTSAENAGAYLADAELSYDTENYNEPILLPCPWEIRKAQYDMSRVVWEKEDDFIYDGTEKNVYLTQLPPGVSAVYENNRKTNAGEYCASAVLSYDENNYEKPLVEDFPWEIRKAEYDMSGVHWNYEKPFIYDGRIKSVTLEKPKNRDGGFMRLFRHLKNNASTGLPEGVNVVYEHNGETDAGCYKAAAIFHVDDPDNYEVPDTMVCEWEIQKAEYDMSRVSWEQEKTFVYDGEIKEIRLINLPDGITASYSGNRAAETGIYEASAVLELKDGDNYEMPASILPCRWEIKKGKYNMNGAKWAYDDVLVYDGNVKRVYVSGLPDGVRAVCSGNEQTEAGVYIAEAMLDTDDSDNYEIPVMESFRWEIKKREYDMSNVVWDYSEPFVYDGIEKIVALRGLPTGVNVTYRNNRGIDAGIFIAEAFFTVDDEKNYEIPAALECKWKIEKAEYDMSGVRWDYGEPFTYDGRSKSIQLTGLPGGITPVYSDNSKIEAGTYVADVQFEYDEENYMPPAVLRCKWKINKDFYDMSNVEWVYDEAFVYDASEKQVFLRGLPDGVTARYENNRAIDAGVYDAHVHFIYDNDNYFEPDSVGICHWEIKKADAELKLLKNLYIKELGERKFTPDYETNADNMSYRVVNDNVASVSDSGKITLLSAGRTSVFITAGGSNYNEVTKEIVVEVNEKK